MIDANLLEIIRLRSELQKQSALEFDNFVRGVRGIIVRSDIDVAASEFEIQIISDNVWGETTTFVTFGSGGSVNIEIGGDGSTDNFNFGDRSWVRSFDFDIGDDPKDVAARVALNILEMGASKPIVKLIHSHIFGRNPNTKFPSRDL